MTNEQLASLRQILENRKKELEEAMRDNADLFQVQTNPSLAGEPHVDFNHPADTVLGDPDYEKELNLIARERLEWELVQQALTRMEQGRYGVCGSCEEDISFARLKAIPYARYCLSCQEDLDRQLAS